MRQVPLVLPTFDEDGWFVGFGGGRRHKTVKMTTEEFVVRCVRLKRRRAGPELTRTQIYSASNPYTGKGRYSQSSPPLQ